MNSPGKGKHNILFWDYPKGGLALSAHNEEAQMPKSIHSAEYKMLTELLIATRKRAGLTQQQLADKLGRPQSWVAKTEGGERRLDIIEFLQLLRAIGADPRMVIGVLDKQI